MQLSKKCGITPEKWGNVSLKDFVKKFKYIVSDEDLEKAHKECVKIYKALNKKDSIKVEEPKKVIEPKKEIKSVD